MKIWSQQLRKLDIRIIFVVTSKDRKLETIPLANYDKATWTRVKYENK